MSLESREIWEKPNFHDSIISFWQQVIRRIEALDIPTSSNTKDMMDIPELYLTDRVDDEREKKRLTQFMQQMTEKIQNGASNRDVYAWFQDLWLLLADPDWTEKFTQISGYNWAVAWRALPIYLRLISEYLIKWVFVWWVHNVLSSPQQKAILLKFIQFHEWRLAEYIRSNDENGIFMYRWILPSVCMNYALVSLYREDFETVFDFIQRWLDAAIQTKSRVLAIKTIIIYLRLLRSLRDREVEQNKKNEYLEIEKALYQKIWEKCAFLQQNGWETDDNTLLLESSTDQWYTSVRSQYFIAKFLALPIENGQLPLQAYNACRDADAEDKMLYVLGRICRIASGATNHIDDVMGLIEVNHEKDHFIILIPGIIALIEKFLLEENIEWKSKEYLDRSVVYISRFLRRKEKQREDFEGLSWFQQYFPLLKRYFHEVVKAENVSDWSDATLLAQVEIVDYSLQNSFHERYKQYFPLYFQIPIGKDVRMFMYDVNGIKEIKKIPDTIVFQEVHIVWWNWKISGVWLRADMDFWDICKWIVPNLRQNLVNQSLSTLSVELIESLWAIGGSLSMYVQDIGEVQHTIVELQRRIAWLLTDRNDQSQQIIEDIASLRTRIGDIMENMKLQSAHIPDTLEHLRKQLTELSWLAAFDLSLPEIWGCPNDKWE